MLPNPLTPPNEYSAEAVGLAEEVGYQGAHEPVTQLSFATPVSNVSMGLDEQDELPNVGRTDEQYMTDEDEDMSESGGGGALLTMTLSHAEALNAELDMLDAELMGPQNLSDMYMDQYYPPPFDPYSFHEPESQMDQPEPPQDTHMHGSGSLVNLPSAMSQVSLHLQHLQEEQEHAEAAEVMDEDMHIASLNNSTPSILLNFLSNMHTTNVGVATGPQLDYVSPTELHTTNTLPSATGLSQPLPPHLWSTEGSTPSPALDVVVPAPSQSPSFHISTEPTIVVVITDDASEADQNEVDEPFNLSVGDFLYTWGTSALASQESRKRPQGPDLSSLSKQRAQKLPIMQNVDLNGEDCDMQRINWTELGISRLEARQMRRHTYRNYQNLRLPHQWHPRLNGAKLVDDQDFFRFRRMDFNHTVNLSHFQLRNLLSCAYRDHVFYAGRSKIMQWQPGSGTTSGQPSVAMDLTDPVVQSFYSHHHGIQISTLTVGHDILVAGGFNGEYALVNLRSPKSTKHTEGLLTNHVNSITNFIQVNLSRSSSSPLAAFASNDMGMRILDVNTNKFIAEHKYDHAINCTAMSPDRRLRVLVGDTRQVMICNADTGEVLQSLDGHRDFGFACDWADDGWTVATGNQDMQVKIWDARNWTNRQGHAQPLATIAAEMAGVRKLKFSPLGSGKRVLLAAEPADIVSVIDADSFTSKQTLSFFGEVGGVDFTNGGRDVLIANCDNMRGGIMEYERCDLAGNDVWGMEEDYYGKDRTRCRRPKDGYDWVSDDEVVEHRKAQGTWQQRTRQAATLGASLPHF